MAGDGRRHARDRCDGVCEGFAPVGREVPPDCVCWSFDLPDDEPPVPDIDAMRDELDFVQYEYEPGDCTIHHGLLSILLAAILPNICGAALT